MLLPEIQIFLFSYPWFPSVLELFHVYFQPFPRVSKGRRASKSHNHENLTRLENFRLHYLFWSSFAWVGAFQEEWTFCCWCTLVSWLSCRYTIRWRKYRPQTALEATSSNSWGPWPRGETLIRDNPLTSTLCYFFWHILGMQNSELAVGISQLANMCRIFCWQVVISSLTKYSQLITTTLHSRANSVNYKNAPRLNLRLSHVPESAITWLETRSCHRILCCFSIIKQIFNSRPIKRNEILYVQFSENTTTHVGESAKELINAS